MSLIFADSYDHYQTANLAQKYVSVSTGNSVVPSVGQCASQALSQIQQPSTTGVLPKFPTATPTGATANVMFAVNSPSGHTNPIDLFQLWQGSIPIFRCQHNMDGSVTGIRNPDAAFPPIVFVTPGGLVPHSVLTMVGCRVLLSNDDLTGAFELQVNGVTVYTASGINTSVDGPTWTNCQLGGKSQTTQTVIFDSFVLGDGTGSAPQNGLLGQFQVEWLHATGAGANTAFSVVGAANNWNVSDNNTPAPLSAYISSSTPGNIDTYVYSDVPVIGGGTIYGVQSSILGYEVSAGTRDIQAEIRQGGTNTPSGVDVGVPVTDPAYLITMMQNNPQTAAGWSFSQVNANEYGVNLTV